MRDENPIRTLRDYSRPSREGYSNTIKLPEGNNVVPLRSGTIRLVQNECSFHRLRSKDPNQHLKDFLKLMDSHDLDESLYEAWTRFKDLLQKVPHHGIDHWLQVQIFYDHVNPVTRQTINQSAGGKLRDLNPEESWEILEDLALYDNEIWNDPRDFAKPVKAIALPQDVPSTSDRRLIELENQVQRLMEAHLAPTQPTQVNKITTPCEIYSGPHDTQCCMENPEQAFVEYASSRTDEAGGKWYTFKPEQKNLGDTYNPSWRSHPNLRWRQPQNSQNNLSNPPNQFQPNGSIPSGPFNNRPQNFYNQSNIEGLVSKFMASQDARLSKFEADFKQQQSEIDRIFLQVQIFYDHVNLVTRRTIDQSAGGKLRDLNHEESWAILEDLTLYDNDSWNDPRDFAKPVKEIALPQDVPSTSDRRLIELKNQVQRLMETHLAPIQPTQVNKITTPCEICSGPHDTQCCMENPEVAFVEYTSSCIDEAGEGLVSEFMASQDAKLSKFEANFKQQQSKMTNKINTVLKAFTDRIAGTLPSDTVKIPKLGTHPVSFAHDDGEVMFIKIIRDDEPQNEDPHEVEGATTEEPVVEYFDTFPTRDELTYHRIKGMHVFVGNFTYFIDFMIVEDISSILDPRLSQVVLGRPFIEISNMTHDPPEGVVRFIRGTNEVAYKMPHKIEQYDSLSNLEKEHTKSVYLRNEEDKRRGVEYVISKILGFYKECLELGPEYLIGVDDEGEVT
ncbi:hypothetical protein Tco_0665211 [Tanacetum coccineum]